jgi:trk system potassium uptake protein
VLGEWQSSIGIYLAFVGMSLTGYIMNTLGEKSPLNLKQSSIVVVLSFVLLSLFGSLPYMYINPFWEGIDSFSLFASSFLESTSGLQLPVFLQYYIQKIYLIVFPFTVLTQNGSVD